MNKVIIILGFFLAANLTASDTSPDSPHSPVANPEIHQIIPYTMLSVPSIPNAPVPNLWDIIDKQTEERIKYLIPSPEQRAKALGYKNFQDYMTTRTKRPASAELVDDAE